MNTKCRAKNPSQCWRHGNQQGVVAKNAIYAAIAPERNIQDAHANYAHRPLKTMNAPTLAVSIVSFAQNTPHIKSENVNRAIREAAMLHENDLRSNRGKYDVTPYIEHPLRNTKRIIRFGCKDEATLIGSVLHDTVEDHPFEISEKLAGKKAATEEEARVNSFEYIGKTYGKDVERVVRGMSNPIVVDKYMRAEKKNAIYAEHVKEAIEDGQVCVAKVADFIDNAIGLYHNEKTMSSVSLYKKSTKYLPVMDILEERLKRGLVNGDLPVPDEGVKAMIQQIQSGRERLKALNVKHKALMDAAKK